MGTLGLMLILIQLLFIASLFVITMMHSAIAHRIPSNRAALVQSCIDKEITA